MNGPVDDLRLTVRPDGVRLTVRVQPRASREGIAGVRDGALVVRVNAPPVDDAANDAVIALLARIVDLPRGSIQIVTGHRSRTKVVAMTGLSAEALLPRLRNQTSDHHEDRKK